MTQTEQTPLDPFFFQLVSSIYSTAMLQMGKVMSPLTGKVERQMELAKNTIDLLAMLEAKTKGNLTSTEQEYLNHTLYELRMNYLDESEHPSDANESPTGKAPEAPTGGDGGASTGN